MMESLIREWDGETVIVRYDQATGTWIFIAIHSTQLGPATGGTRMKHYPDQEAAIEDALRLAAGMTYKFAVPGIERGGGKAVISIPKYLEPETRRDLLRRYGRLVHQLGGFFYTGPIWEHLPLTWIPSLRLVHHTSSVAPQQLAEQVHLAQLQRSGYSRVYRLLVNTSLERRQ